jgi:hypothetical protein
VTYGPIWPTWSSLATRSSSQFEGSISPPIKATGSSVPRSSASSSSSAKPLQRLPELHRRAASLGRKFELDAESLVLAGRVVLEYGFYSALFQERDTPNWTCGPPSDVGELLDEKDLQAYVKCRAMRDFDEGIPVFAVDRVQYIHTKRRDKRRPGETDEFNFIGIQNCAGLRLKAGRKSSRLRASTFLELQRSFAGPFSKPRVAVSTVRIVMSEFRERATKRARAKSPQGE